ncbi:MAG: translocation/assembly module TamB domain-containing protein, partial [Pigmentiphaga sp.]
GLAGQADLAGEVRGLPERHGLTLKGSLTLPPGLLPEPSSESMQVSIEEGQLIESDPSPLEEAIDLPAVLAEGPYRFDVMVEGGWGPGVPEAWQAGRLGWRGRIARLAIHNPKIGLQLLDPLLVDVAMPAGEQPLAWRLGSTRLQLELPYRRRVVLVHQGSDGSGDHWRSAGRLDDLVPAWVVAQLPRSTDPLRLDLAWDLERAASLTGQVQLRRRAGDIEIPGEQAVALGLQALRLDLVAEAAGTGASTLRVEAHLAGNQLGRLDLDGSTRMVLSGGVPMVTEQEPIRLDARLALDDLSWLMAFTGDETEVGGRLNGDVRLERAQGEWQATGSLQGDQLRVVRIEEGVRLLNGSLRARFTQDRVEIDSLRFPSEIRTVPSNRAVQAWVNQYGKEGLIEASGSWSLADAAGEVNVRVSRFPLVQRVDRFVAGSGDIRIEASPRRLEISGKVVADIGWVNIEGADELPSLASDVVIVRDGQPAEASAALPMRLNLEVDLGQQMMLTGMGLNTGLTGSIQIRNGASGLRGTGVIHTRDGRFSIYGQTLVVRQGAITFQGPIDDPLLDIIAVRPNLQIEAGVQIIGTARRPEITLVSFPDVSDVEKLSWLLLGRGPDARGADAGLLLSAAASLLGNGEPLYRQFGLDELGLRSGLGSGVQGLLPDRTVVGSVTSSNIDNEAGQFLVAGKRLSDSLYLTFEQALSGREAAVRLSYRVSERLSLSLQGGTINGLRLMWSLLW